MAHRPKLFLVAVDGRRTGAAASVARNRRISSKLASTTSDGMPRRFQLLTRCAYPESESMPSSLAKAASPPAAEMSAFDSSLSMSREVTRRVYPLSNTLCTRGLNGSFTVAAMALTWTRLLKLAWDHAQLSEDALRAELRKVGVSSQTATNWRNRPIPIGQFAALSQIIGVSTDVLHGKAGPKGAPRSPDDPDSIGRRIAKLDDGPRNVILAMLRELEGQRAPRTKAAER